MNPSSIPVTVTATVFLSPVFFGTTTTLLTVPIRPNCAQLVSGGLVVGGAFGGFGGGGGFR